MNWPDEKYVKVYTRDTLTWKSWCWQARTVFSLLVRKLDGAGLIETGRMDPVDALALQLDLPRDVVAVGLPPILECGTAETVPGGLLVPKWIEAQESTKTEAQKKRDQRSRVRDQRRIAQVSEIRQSPVPECPALSPAVPGCPPPAQPSPTTSPAQPPAQKETTSSASPPLVLVAAFGPEDLQRLWNERKPAKAPVWRDMTDKRRKVAAARISEGLDAAGWLEVLDAVNASDFLSGRRSDFVANGPWCLNPENLAKIRDGNYRNTGAGPPTKGAGYRQPGATGEYDSWAELGAEVVNVG